MKVKDLKYWKDRAGQIAWRLQDEMAWVNTMRGDLAECDWEIKRLEAEAKAEGRKP